MCDTFTVSFFLIQLPKRNEIQPILNHPVQCVNKSDKSTPITVRQNG